MTDEKDISPDLAERRQRLLMELRRLGIQNPQVLAAFEAVPRHAFVPEAMQADAYANHPLSIGHGQTISQPYIVARMTQGLMREPLHKVLEIGTGSGYQTAILAEVAEAVYSIERISALHEQATARLKALGYTNIHTRYADGHEGWPEVAPFDAIIVTALADETPQTLLSQLAEGGRLVCPVMEDQEQVLKCFTRRGNDFDVELMDWVRFVPFKKGIE